jgi:Fe-S-cluster-containing dehydrogenase component
MKSGEKASNIPGEDMHMESRSRISLRKASPGKSGEKTGETDRRNFLHTSLVAAASLTVLGSLHEKKAFAANRTQQALPREYPKSFPGGSQLERMRRELLESLQKPVSERKWVMVIDQQKCVGCRSCTSSCCSENNLPPGVVYRPVPEYEVGKFPNVAWVFTPRPCMHCDKPPCVPVCPVTATWKREDGIVVIDYDICIGCRNCLAACPYDARTFDFGEFYGGSTPRVMPYETRPNYEYSEEWKRKPGTQKSPIGNARKCHFCLHRIRSGMLPACVTTCLGGATYFGDAENKRSLVHELVGSARARRLKEELGTEPSVYYLV